MAAAYFSPPAESSIPDGPDGDAIRRGMALFVNTKTNAADFVGNELSCASCHLDRGREPHSAPMRSEEHTSELQSLMRISYAVFCLKTQTCQTRVLRAVLKRTADIFSLSYLSQAQESL